MNQSHNNLPYLTLRSLLKPGAILGLLFILQSCDIARQSTIAPISQEPIGADKTIKEMDHKIALLVPLSGQHQRLGQSLQKAAELSLFEQGDEDLNLVIYDTKSTKPGAEQAALKAINANVNIIVGPVFSEHVQVVAPLARRAAVPVLSLSTNKMIAGTGVFVLGFSPEEQVRYILNYALNRGKKTIGVLIPHNAYGTLVENEVKTLKTLRPELKIEFIFYSANTQNLSKDLNPLRTMTLDALFIPEGGPTLLKLISAILYQDISLEKIQLLGTGQWDDDLIFQNISLHGAWIAAPDPQERGTFMAKYKQAYAQEPERIASLAYDAIAMLSVLKKHEKHQAYAFSSLTQKRGFDGIDGVFRLRPDGITERQLTIAEITSSGLQVLVPAQKRF